MHIQVEAAKVAVLSAKYAESRAHESEKKNDDDYRCRRYPWLDIQESMNHF